MARSPSDLLCARYAIWALGLISGPARLTDELPVSYAHLPHGSMLRSLHDILAAYAGSCLHPTASLHCCACVLRDACDV